MYFDVYLVREMTLLIHFDDKCYVYLIFTILINVNILLYMLHLFK